MTVPGIWSPEYDGDPGLSFEWLNRCEMAVDLEELTRAFAQTDDCETATAFYRTRTPWVAPEAYLHTIYKPASVHVLAEVNGVLQLPDPLIDQLRTNSGAMLFSGSMCMFGAVGSGQLLDRSKPFGLPPYSLVSANRVNELFEEGIIVGGYGVDGFKVILERKSGLVRCLGAKKEELARWNSIDSWLTGEWSRLGSFFGCDGGPRNSNLLPGSPQIPC